MVRGYLPPGVEKGDTFDIEVVVPPKSKTTSLRNGYLLKSRLREMRVLDNAVHSGNVAGLAQGTVIVDSIFGGADDEVLETRGRVLGGGQAQISRPLGLADSRRFHGEACGDDWRGDQLRDSTSRTATARVAWPSRSGTTTSS